jgi:hypothetical protein
MAMRERRCGTDEITTKCVLVTWPIVAFPDNWLSAIDLRERTLSLTEQKQITGGKGPHARRLRTLDSLKIWN